jgi:uncharacterized protein (TIGR03000 family)
MASSRQWWTWGTAVVGFASVAIWIGDLRAQCPCGAQHGVTSNPTGEVIYEGLPAVMGVQEISDEAKLQENDDPSKTINLRVIVHDKAVVTINGEPTTTKGISRPYIVRNLVANKQYRFKIEALVKQEDGAEYYSEKTETITAGDTKEVVLHVRRRKRQEPPKPAVPAIAETKPATSATP